VAAVPAPGNTDNGAGPAGSPVIPYQVDAPNAYKWTEIAYDYLLAQKLTAGIRTLEGISTATVNGTCPYCTDDVNFTEVLDAVTGESMATLSRRARPSVAADDGYVPLTVTCRCAGQHPGRPDGVRQGCGINFRVEVRRDA